MKAFVLGTVMSRITAIDEGDKWLATVLIKVGIPGDTNFDTIFSSMPWRSLKNIIVFNAPPQINFAFAFVRSQQNINWNCTSPPHVVAFGPSILVEAKLLSK